MWAQLIKTRVKPGKEERARAAFEPEREFVNLEVLEEF